MVDPNFPVQTVPRVRRRQARRLDQVDAGHGPSRANWNGGFVCAWQPPGSPPGAARWPAPSPPVGPWVLGVPWALAGWLVLCLLLRTTRSVFASFSL
jgi:hypothetical protein